MNALTKPLRALLDRIDGLSPRERVIVFATGLLLIWGLMDLLLLGPADQARRGQSQRLADLSHRAAAAEAALASLVGQPDPAVRDRERLATLRAELDRRLTALPDRLHDPRDMPRVLEGLLARPGGPRLASLRSLPAEAVGQAPGQEATAHALWRHGLELVLEGDYAALTRYLETVEGAGLGLFWGPAELDATDHPRLRLTLTVYTLSGDSTWMKM